jgi:hypothetical protein
MQAARFERRCLRALVECCCELTLAQCGSGWVGGRGERVRDHHAGLAGECLTASVRVFANGEHVQQVLRAHKASGDRSHKHRHYLVGALHCKVYQCRLGYGRHRGNGGVYEYFSCLSRMSKQGRCVAPTSESRRLSSESSRNTSAACLTQPSRPLFERRC